MSSRIQRAKRLLAGTGITREDSDDELGLEDHPWEWIYAKDHGAHSQTIVGACMGDFSCSLGDCVLLKAEGSKEAWVGLICDFLDNDVEKAANFMWFSSEKEIRNKQKKRTDAMPVCFKPLRGNDELIIQSERTLYNSILGRQPTYINQWDRLYSICAKVSFQIFIWKDPLVFSRPWQALRMPARL